jgi:hypothetical protein
MIVPLSDKRVFSLLLLFLFFTNFLYSFSQNRVLLRDIKSQNHLKTEHFNIYWSNKYPLSQPWLIKDSNNTPSYITKIETISEELYQTFLDKSLNLAPQIEIYVANSGMEADGLYTNNITSMGAFTSDDYPEILINGNFPQKKLSTTIKRVLAHEMFHIVQYQNKLILGENNTSKTDKWFIEGTAVAMEVEITNNPKYLYEYFEDLINNIDDGFFSIKDNLIPYSNGYLFYYLQQKYNYSLNDFIKIYKIYHTPKEFINKIALEQNLTANQLIKDIYNSFLYQKNLYGDSFKNIDIDSINESENINFGGVKIGNYNLNIKKGWQLISLPIDISEFTIFNDIENFLIWNYKNGKWGCLSNDEEINNICNKNYSLINYIDKRDGFWLKSEENISKSIKVFDNK